MHHLDTCTLFGVGKNYTPDPMGFDLDCGNNAIPLLPQKELSVLPDFFAIDVHQKHHNVSIILMVTLQQ